MFERFSSGYYLGRLYVEPHENERSVMHRDLHERVHDQLYDDAEESAPLVMKIGSAHVPVHGADGVPGRTVALPRSVLAAIGVENPPALSEVLLAKADRASQLLDIGSVGAGDPAGF
jgi:UDP-N-acetylglucosamine enolpyruvyl transferase